MRSEKRANRYRGTAAVRNIPSQAYPNAITATIPRPEMETPDEKSHDKTRIEYTMPPIITTTGLVRRIVSSEWRGIGRIIIDQHTGS
ncbi:hypothetical protein JCM17092_27450 [Haloplanus litoreus]